MKAWLRIVAIVAASVVALLGLFMAAIVVLSEMGEVVTIETALPDGGRRTTRIWIVDTPDGPLVRGTGGKPWVDGARLDPEVRVTRAGTSSNRRAVELTEAADYERARRLMREKYGIADQVIDLLRDLDDTAVFRLDPSPGGGT